MINSVLIWLYETYGIIKYHVKRFLHFKLKIDMSCKHPARKQAIRATTEDKIFYICTGCLMGYSKDHDDPRSLTELLRDMRNEMKATGKKK